MSSQLRSHIHYKFKQNELPHFVIYEHLEKNENLDQAILEMIAPLSLNHPDLLVIRPEDGSYKVDDGNLESLMKFLSHRPIESQKKWVVWTQTEILTPVILNKLLKTLEEPPVFAQILFLHKKGSPLLSTIKSRAIIFREQEKINDTEFKSEFFEKTNKEAFVKARDFDEEEEVKFLAQLTNSIKTYNSAQNFLMETKNIEKKRPYHQSAGHRIFRYLNLKS